MVIGFDIRRSGSFGVGSYIKSLVRAFARRPAHHEYVLVGSAANQEAFPDLPENFRFLRFEKSFSGLSSHWRLQFLLRPLSRCVSHPASLGSVLYPVPLRGHSTRPRPNSFPGSLWLEAEERDFFSRFTPRLAPRRQDHRRFPSHQTRSDQPARHSRGAYPRHS